MFEISRIVNSRSEYGHCGGGDVWWSDVLKSAQQVTGIISDRAHIAAIENLREGALHDFAILQNIGNAGRTAQIIFQHVVLAVAVSYEVGSRNVTPGSIWRIHADTSATK